MSKQGESDPKALVGATIKTTRDVQSDFSNRIIPKGTPGVVIECYQKPTEGYCVDLSIPNPDLVGGHEYENVILTPDQFEVTKQGTGSLYDY